MDIGQILTAVIPVVIIGLICAAVLVAASKLMAVKEDEKFPKIRECLPGANCGACGYAGCDGYARALCDDPAVPVNLCIPGGASVAGELGGILGVEAGSTVKKVAVVHCSGDCTKTEDKVIYEGIESCRGAKLMFGGKGSCTFGCLGFGDCMKACPQEAICIADGVARVNGRLCIGCGICVKTCPNGIISLQEEGDKVVVTCSNKDKGAVTRKICENGCIGCKKCERVCPEGAIKVIDNLAVIDYGKCEKCSDFGMCAKNCTVGCIMISDRSGVHRIK